MTCSFQAQSRLPSLPSGIYALVVSAPGFNQYIQEGIQVQVAQTARVDVVLKIGATSESVTVQANAPLLRTENAEQSQTLSGDEIDKLPLTLGGNNLYGTRNPLAGLSLSPGVSQVVGTNFQFRTTEARTPRDSCWMTGYDHCRNDIAAPFRVAPFRRGR